MSNMKKVTFADQDVQGINNLQSLEKEIEEIRKRNWTPRMLKLKDLDNHEVSLNVRPKTNNEHNQFVQDLMAPHIESFNWFTNVGIYEIIKHASVEFGYANNEKQKIEDKICIWIKDIHVNKPTKEKSDTGEKLLPFHCRVENLSYTGEVVARFAWKINGVEDHDFLEKCIGRIPIMLRSSKCHLANLTPSQLIEKGEDGKEAGGYFIANGNEKVLRMLLVQKRNYPMALKRGGWKKKNDLFTEYGINVRCVPSDNRTVAMNTLHFMETGSMKLSITWKKQAYYLDVMLVIRALSASYTDVAMYADVMRGISPQDGNEGFMKYMMHCLKAMFREAYNKDTCTHEGALNHIGNLFRCELRLPSYYTDKQVAEFLLDNTVCIHLSDNRDKVAFLAYMIRKLFYFVQNKIAEENLDNPMFQEATLPGHAIQMIYNDVVDTFLKVATRVVPEHFKKGEPVNGATIKKALMKMAGLTGSVLKCFTKGCYQTSTDLGQVLTEGLVVTAERMNYMRFMAHFRAIYRGHFYTTLRITTPRKLRTEANGFLCPVHTPDGSLCGLLNHLTFMCETVVSSGDQWKNVVGLLPPEDYVERTFADFRDTCQYVQVLFDGNFVGWVKESAVHGICEFIRAKKVAGLDGVPNHLEICYIPKEKHTSMYPGLYLFMSPGRLVRPIENISLGLVEYLGMFEQVYLTICSSNSNPTSARVTHKELNSISMLSETTTFNPFINLNHACRNLFQCQMAKQTVGLPCRNEEYRTDSKTFVLIDRQVPLIRTNTYELLELDEHSQGCSVVVAIMSYTGFDMEDAIIINGDSYQKGLFSTYIYKIEDVDLREQSPRADPQFEFAYDEQNESLRGILGRNGLPIEGVVLKCGDPLLCFRDRSSGRYTVQHYKGYDQCTVDRVYRCDKVKDMLVHAKIKLRYYRRPEIGDKFANRHGQKGVMGAIWPASKMPVDQDGKSPDIIFNPHGIPSRMTYGMILELMAGKAAAQHGNVYNASAFLYNEENGTDPTEFIGDELERAGFDRTGKEIMYSGETGLPLESYVYKGVIYYQRLRHMVSDKWQVRSVGTVDAKTLQPVGGRKKGGGVRFGEMERDALIAHGAAGILQDRMVNCSDGEDVPICTNCKSILTPIYSAPGAGDVVEDWTYKCRACGDDGEIGKVQVPHITVHIAHLLTSAGIKINFDLES